MPSFFSQLSIFIQRLENMPVGWRGIFILAALIISVRVTVEGIFDSRTLFSYWTAIFWESWYFSLFISFIFLISWVARTPRIKIARLLLAGLPVIFLPLLGFLAGSPRYFDFPQGSWGSIFFDIVTLAAFSPHLGLLFSLEILIVLISLFLFFYKRVSVGRSFMGVFGFYAILVLFALQGKIFQDSPISNILLTNLKESQLYAGINFIFFICLSAFLFAAVHPKKAAALFFQLRPERSMSLAMFGVLMMLGTLLTGHVYVLNFVFGFALFGFLLLYAALVNDVKDIRIDAISNPNRPLASGVFATSEIRLIQRIVLGVIIVFVLIFDSMPIMLLTLLTLAFSFLYSNLYVRKYLFSYLLVAAGESTVVLFGYFSQEPVAESLSRGALDLFLAVFTLFAFFLPVKDLKDFEGDRQEGVRNFLTVFGWQRGKFITASSVFCGYIFFGTMVGDALILFLSAVFAILGAAFVIYYKRIGEKASYVNFFVFVLTFFLLSFI